MLLKILFYIIIQISGLYAEKLGGIKLNKKFGKLFLTFILLLVLIPLNTFAESEIKLWIDGNYVEADAAPFIEESRTLVPLRVVSENLGLSVDWNSENKQVTISNGVENILFFIGEKYYEKNDTQIPMDAAPKIVSDRTFVPIRVIAELFNKEVNWDSANRTVVIGNGYNSTPQNKEVTAKKENTEKIPAASNSNALVSNTSGNGSNFNTYDIPTTAQYIGNSSKKKLHLGNCESTKKIAPQNRVVFNSREEAIYSGYVPCKRCNP